MKDQVNQCYQRDLISRFRKLQLKAVFYCAVFLIVFTVAQVLVEEI